MRLAALVLVAVAVAGCKRGALQADARVIELHGAWCDTLFSSRSPELVVYYGCPGG